MDLLDLNGLARANEIRWYGPVLRSDRGDVLRRALDCKWLKEKGVGARR